MKTDNSSRDQAGFAHLGLFLLLLIVIGGIGFAGYRVLGKDSTVATPQSTQQTVNVSTGSQDKAASKSVLEQSTGTEETQ
ncbi:MAG: hypothetical protein AAB436_02360 [Patescibacteria group bacterium]